MTNENMPEFDFVSNVQPILEAVAKCEDNETKEFYVTIIGVAVAQYLVMNSDKDYNEALFEIKRWIAFMAEAPEVFTEILSHHGG